MPLDSMGGLAPLKSHDYYSSLVPDEFAVRKSLSMLHDKGMDVPKVKLYKPRPTRARGQEAQAYVDTREENPAVNLNRNTQTYRDANNNNPEALMSLASQLAHENQHIQGGPSEGSAYDEQIKALKLFGARPDAIENAMRSRAHVVGLGR